MTAIHILQTTFEIIFAALLIYGFCNESKVIEWEVKQREKISNFIKERECKNGRGNSANY